MNRPNRADIAAALGEAGISLAQVKFFTDEEGVDNADIYPGEEPDEVYRAKVEKLMSYAAHSGAAMGFHLKPQSDDDCQFEGSSEQRNKSSKIISLFGKIFGAGR